MKARRKKGVSMVATDTPPSRARKTRPRRGARPAPASTVTNLLGGQRKAEVLHEMPTIRWLLAMHHFQADEYSDDAIADALLETCPRPDDFWLRSEHLALAARRFKPA